MYLQATTAIQPVCRFDAVVLITLSLCRTVTWFNAIMLITLPLCRMWSHGSMQWFIYKYSLIQIFTQIKKGRGLVLDTCFRYVSRSWSLQEVIASENVHILVGVKG